MKIKILKGVAIKSEHKEVGSVVDVENNLALQLLSNLVFSIICG